MRKLYVCKRCEEAYLGEEPLECRRCGGGRFKELKGELTTGPLKEYDNIVVLTGLNIDKRLLNESLRRLTEGEISIPMVLTSNVSDAQTITLLLYKQNYRARSPFADKNVLHIYGDGPYTFNQFVGNVYLVVPYKDLANKLREYALSLWRNGKWGWELLSYVFREYMSLRGLDYLGYEVCVEGGENLKNRLTFLARLASPPQVSYPDEELILSNKPEDNDYTVPVPIMRVIPSINTRLLKSVLNELDGDTAFLSIGGAEHNIFLNLAVVERRETYAKTPQDRVIYDLSNVFDRELFGKLVRNKVALTTHGYVGLKIQDAEGRVITMARGVPGSSTGGVIIKLRHRFEFYGRDADLYVVFGAGPKGALATKLTLIRMLLPDAAEKLKGYGIYYVTFHKEDAEEKEARKNRWFKTIYLEADPIHDAALLAPLLSRHDLEPASTVTTVLV